MSGEAGQDRPVRALDAPPEVGRLARVLREAGFEAWAVGGAVRDALAGLHPEDWDLATSARPADVRRLFRRTVPIGIEHGTVGVLGKDGRMYEVTTFRLDVETDGRHARVAFSDRLDDDLQRRDFTINAVAWNPITREVYDPHGGMDDLARGVLRTVGDPEQRFAEDRLRVLRALRFAGRFGLEIEPETWTAVQLSADRLNRLSAERIREELLKVLGGQRMPSRTLRLYERSGVLAALYPELSVCVRQPFEGLGIDLWTYLLRAADAVPRTRRTLRLTALLHGIGIPGSEHVGHAAAGAARARALLQRLKLSNAETDTVTHLIAQHSPIPAPGMPDPELRRWIRTIGPEYLRDLFRLWIAGLRAQGDRCDPGAPARLRTLRARCHRLLAERVPLEIAALAIGGSDLKQLGLPPGPLYGEILRDLLERVLDDPSLNERERLLDLVREQVS